ncbi:hypothetical protein ACYCFK_09515 [Stutzerimonas stutzeri]
MAINQRVLGAGLIVQIGFFTALLALTHSKHILGNWVFWLSWSAASLVGLASLLLAELAIEHAAAQLNKASTSKYKKRYYAAASKLCAYWYLIFALNCYISSALFDIQGSDRQPLSDAALLSSSFYLVVMLGLYPIYSICRLLNAHLYLCEKKMRDDRNYLAQETEGPHCSDSHK